MGKNSYFCIAPMMAWSTPHARYLWRLIAPSCLLYTEMRHANAIIHGNRDELLKKSTIEQPVVAQLGGSDPKLLAEAATIVADYGFDEVNLNIGCPSSRVQSGSFGACLMRQPELVADCVAAMQNHVDIPVTVKCRLGVDDQDCEETLSHFINIVSAVGVNTFIIHARKALLNGLNPKDNRTIPPLNYERVVRLINEFPHCQFILNGGINTLDIFNWAMENTHGAMCGRVAWNEPWKLREFEIAFFGEEKTQVLPDRISVLSQYSQYAMQQVMLGVSPYKLVMPLAGLFRGETGSKYWRKLLGSANPETFKKILNAPHEYYSNLS